MSMPTPSTPTPMDVREDHTIPEHYYDDPLYIQLMYMATRLEWNPANLEQPWRDAYQEVFQIDRETSFANARTVRTEWPCTTHSTARETMAHSQPNSRGISLTVISDIAVTLLHLRRMDATRAGSFPFRMSALLLGEAKHGLPRKFVYTDFFSPVGAIKDVSST
ncbi:hypothetical protein EXIGLDRAFT_708012, partial [Exidia glandulosa HHB12029]